MLQQARSFEPLTMVTDGATVLSSGRRASKEGQDGSTSGGIAVGVFRCVVLFPTLSLVLQADRCWRKYSTMRSSFCISTRVWHQQHAMCHTADSTLVLLMLVAANIRAATSCHTLPAAMLVQGPQMLTSSHRALQSFQSSSVSSCAQTLTVRVRRR